MTIMTAAQGVNQKIWKFKEIEEEQMILKKIVRTSTTM